MRPAPCVNAQQDRAERFDELQRQDLGVMDGREHRGGEKEARDPESICRFGGDDTDFNATPALSDGELFLRSNHNLYCVSARK